MGLYGRLKRNHPNLAKRAGFAYYFVLPGRLGVNFPGFTGLGAADGRFQSIQPVTPPPHLPLRL